MAVKEKQRRDSTKTLEWFKTGPETQNPLGRTQKRSSHVWPGAMLCSSL
jgi:hypothetical protein